MLDVNVSLNKMKGFQHSILESRCDIISIHLHAVFIWRGLILVTGPQGAGVWREAGSSTCRLWAPRPGSRAKHPQQKEVQTAAASSDNGDAASSSPGGARKPPEVIRFCLQNKSLCFDTCVLCLFTVIYSNDVNCVQLSLIYPLNTNEQKKISIHMKTKLIYFFKKKLPADVTAMR